MGLGRRTFAPGEVLTASNVMNYLQDQAVMNFAGTAARGSAIGTAVAQGMASYLNDSNNIEFYNGTAWRRPKGTIVQTIYASTTTQVTTTSTSFQNTGLTANITPLYSDSRILVYVSQNGIWRLGGGSFDGVWVALTRDSTNVLLDGPKGNTQTVANMLGLSSPFVYSEISGNTTTRTYKTMFRSSGTNLSYVQGDSAASSIIIMEVVQ